MTRHRVRSALGALLLACTVAACTGEAGPAAGPQPSTPPSESHATTDDTAPETPLRTGEQRVSVEMAEPYTPSAPTGVGTDDYRCFLLDPGLAGPAYLTGLDVRPGNPDVVHHVILFRVPPAQVAQAELVDERSPGPGWTCFGDSGIGSSARLDDAQWLGAWAPGSEETVHQAGYGVPMPRGTRVVMQVHYNLLGEVGEDVSAARLRLAPGSSGLTPLRTVLLPAPVELPCRPAHDDGPLCGRAAALADAKARFGEGPGSLADILHLFCRTPVRAGQVQSCTRSFAKPMTIRAAAGHMHLLGREIRIEANPGTPRARTLLDIDVWNFDDQGATAVRPLRLRPLDTLRVTCRHVQWLRDELPAFEGQPDRYVLWGEGTTDEMCLGVLLVT